MIGNYLSSAVMLCVMAGSAPAAFKPAYHEQDYNSHDSSSFCHYGQQTHMLRLPGLLIVYTNIQLTHISPTTVA